MPTAFVAFMFYSHHATLVFYLINLIMNIVILAAGMGKRMQSALPKVLHTLAGKPLLAHVIATAKSLKPTTLSIIYGHGGDLVPNSFTDADIQFAKQSPQLGTGHAVMQAIDLLDDQAPTLVLYGDVPLTKPETLERLIHAAGNDKLGILTVNLDNPTGYGRIVRENGEITRIVEQKDASPAEQQIHEVNTGIMVIPTPKLKQWLATLSNDNAQNEYYLTDIVAKAVADHVAIVASQPDAIAETLGVNSKTQLAALERLHQQDLAHQLLEQGVTLLDPQRIDIRGELICGKDVSIDVNCVFEGKVTIEDGVIIDANCVIKNAHIHSGAQIKPFTHIENAIVGDASLVGPFARLRPGTELAQEVHVGNFVEIKNSQVAHNSKINHLSYIGDTTMGSRVNIGAGTITCNYDGVNKHRTVIEDDVFIGSDSQLIAPVTVGKGANLGAGTTLTKDAPADQLTLSRAKQLTLPGWKRPVKIPKD